MTLDTSLAFLEKKTDPFKQYLSITRGMKETLNDKQAGSLGEKE